MSTRRFVGVMITAIAIAALSVIVRAGGPQNQSAGSAADRDQIAAIVTRWETAWNTHDMAAYAALYHEDGVWVLWTGEVWTGRRAIEEGHAAVHKTIFGTAFNASTSKS